MSFEKALHDFWSGDAELSALLPAARFFTGIAPSSAALPYAVLHNVRSKLHVQTSHSRVDSATSHLTIWSRSLDDAQAIAALVEARLHHADLAFDVGTLRLLQCNARQHAHAPSGRWSVTLELSALVET